MISRRTLFSQLALVAVAGGAWWLRDGLPWPSPRAAFPSGGSSGWLPLLRPDQDVVVVEVGLGGARFSALIDSGAQSSVIDAGLARRLQLKSHLVAPIVLAYGVSGAPRVGRAATFDLSLGRLVLHDVHAAALDLASLSGASGRDFSLILGQDVLRAVVVDLDFAGTRLALDDPMGFRPPDGAVAAPARLRRHELQVPVTIEGRPLQAVLDTGASATLALSRDAAEAAGLLTGRALGYAPSIGFGGLAQDRIFTAAEVEFGGRVYEDVRVHVYEPSGPRIPDGLLGVGALKPFRVILDLGAGRLHLIQSPPHGRAARGGRSSRNRL